MATNESVPEWIQNLSDEQRRAALDKVTQALAEPTEPKQKTEPLIDARTVFDRAKQLTPNIDFSKVGERVSSAVGSIRKSLDHGLRMAKRQKISLPEAKYSLGAAGVIAAVAIATSGGVSGEIRNMPTLLPAHVQKHENLLDKFTGLFHHKKNEPLANEPQPVLVKRPAVPEKKPQPSTVVEKPQKPTTLTQASGSTTQPAEAEKPTKWVPKENAKFDDNGLIRVEPSSVKPGILDLSYKDPKTGEWIIYNNLVPVALVPGQKNPTNAEIDMAKPTRVVRTSNQGEKELAYQYKLSNGAIFDLKIQFDISKKAVSVTTTKSASSAPILEYYLANSWGLKSGVKTIIVDGNRITAGSHGFPKDGYGKTGNFVLGLPGNNTIEILGKNHKQKQKLVSAGNSRFDVMKEDRNFPWEPSQQQLYDTMIGSGPFTEMTGYRIHNLTTSKVELSIN